MNDSIVTFIDYGYIYFDISKIMEEKKLTQSQLVKKTGLHNQIIERYMSGSITRYDKEVLAKLCYVLNCSLDKIMYYVGPNKNKE